VSRFRHICHAFQAERCGGLRYPGRGTARLGRGGCLVFDTYVTLFGRVDAEAWGIRAGDRWLRGGVSRFVPKCHTFEPESEGRGGRRGISFTGNKGGGDL